jgi:predicted transcriptional regulator
MFIGKHCCVGVTLATSEKSRERAPELFLQLASTDRMNIISVLEKENLKLNEISKRLDLTATETLRQLHRMTEACLLTKSSAGNYHVTPYAKLVLSVSSPLDFIARHREYFLVHDAFLLPAAFRARLDELSGCKLIPETIDTINQVTKMFREAKERVDTVILGTEALIEVLRQNAQTGVSVRWLMHEGFQSRAPSVLRTWSTLPEIRSTSAVPGHIIVTDKAAMLTLRNIEGEMTYDSFYGEDAAFLKWAGELFDHEWERAKPWSPGVGSGVRNPGAHPRDAGHGGA